jgi:predicted amidohydrolase
MRIAVVQTYPSIADTVGNLATAAESLREAADAGVDLVVFPECALTGYLFESLEEGMAVAETFPGALTTSLAQLAREHGLHLIAGLLERSGDVLYNSAVLVGPEGHIGTYRKTHTLCLGIDRFATQGDIPYTVYDLPFGRIGILICYDLRFPEAARTLALAGAQLIVLPTNWPQSSTIMPEVFARSRAAENRVYLAAADRVGSERGEWFLGRSVIVSPTGDILREAGSTHPEMLLADLDLSEADQKKVVYLPGQHEMDLLADRRPDLYRTGGLTLTSPYTE